MKEIPEWRKRFVKQEQTTPQPQEQRPEQPQQVPQQSQQQVQKQKPPIVKYTDPTKKKTVIQKQEDFDKIFEEPLKEVGNQSLMQLTRIWEKLALREGVVIPADKWRATLLEIYAQKPEDFESLLLYKNGIASIYQAIIRVAKVGLGVAPSEKSVFYGIYAKQGIPTLNPMISYHGLLAIAERMGIKITQFGVIYESELPSLRINMNAPSPVDWDWDLRTGVRGSGSEIALGFVVTVREGVRNLTIIDKNELQLRRDLAKAKLGEEKFERWWGHTWKEAFAIKSALKKALSAYETVQPIITLLAKEEEDYFAEEPEPPPVTKHEFQSEEQTQPPTPPTQPQPPTQSQPLTQSQPPTQSQQKPPTRTQATPPRRPPSPPQPPQTPQQISGAEEEEPPF